MPTLDTRPSLGSTRFLVASRGFPCVGLVLRRAMEKCCAQGCIRSRKARRRYKQWRPVAAELCGRCSDVSAPPPFAALQQVFTQMDVMRLCAIIRVSRQWADLVRTGAYFRTICLSLDAGGDSSGGADPRYVPALGNHHTKRCAAVDDEVMRRLVHMARGTVTCLYVEGLKNITTSAFDGLKQAQQLRSLTVRDCPKVAALHLTQWLPNSLQCLRLEGSSMVNDASQLRVLKKRLISLSHDRLVVALEECPVCQKVGFPDEPLVCEGCGLQTCSAGCGGAVYVCDGCDKVSRAARRIPGPACSRPHRHPSARSLLPTVSLNAHTHLDAPLPPPPPPPPPAPLSPCLPLFRPSATSAGRASRAPAAARRSVRSASTTGSITARARCATGAHATAARRTSAT